jgi:hypothetical protein
MISKQLLLTKTSTPLYIKETNEEMALHRVECAQEAIKPSPYRPVRQIDKKVQGYKISQKESRLQTKPNIQA